MEITRNLKDINRDDRRIAGGKAVSLGEMINAGFSVPSGFVVLSDAFLVFLQKTKLKTKIDTMLQRIDFSDHASLETASAEIYKMMVRNVIPENISNEILQQYKALDAEYVAVRSSASIEDGHVFSWAGQFESYMTVTEKNVLTSIVHCWASFFSPRALFYRYENNATSEEIIGSVIIQKMISSEVSGVAFSVHPVTKNTNHIVIEAGYGLGEAIVSGFITPDNYIVNKESGKIFTKSIHEQKKEIVQIEGDNMWRMIAHEKRNLQKLSDDNICALAKNVIEIENYFGFPCDIEWAYGKNELHILQSRPITTVKM